MNENINLPPFSGHVAPRDRIFIWYKVGNLWRIVATLEAGSVSVEQFTFDPAVCKVEFVSDLTAPVGRA
jgi:hypothetical protein